MRLLESQPPPEYAMNRELTIKAMRGVLQFPFFLGLLIFLPAWTFAYWQAWVFIAVFSLCTIALTAYVAIYDPKLLERRMKVGVREETEPTQKLIVSIAGACFFGVLVLGGLDHRFGWSDMPASLVLLGDLLIALSYAGFWLVFRENSYAASTVAIMEDQRVISTGPYAIVRHPMYSAALLLFAGMPLALGSWWGLLLLIPAVAGLIWRLVDEEKFLSRNLPGYTEYKDKVRYRLIPSVW
jgi:protein-S-isoprenylcysteine O-methyltransferase Ste14